jgi:hypothetical protein
MVIKCTYILHSKALQNFPKLGFLGMKINHLATLASLLFGRFSDRSEEIGQSNAARIPTQNVSCRKLGKQ